MQKLVWRNHAYRDKNESEDGDRVQQENEDG